jgi:fructokinase
MSQPTALSFGESVVDIYPDDTVVAGSPVHLAAHLARRGWEVTLATRLGDDPHAAEIREVLRRYGISEVAVESDPLLPTGSVTINFGGEGHSFHIHNPAAWDSLELLEIPPADVALFGSLIGRSPVARSALVRLLTQDFAMRVFDVNLRPPDVHVETIRRGLEAATVVKVSAEELSEVARTIEVPAEARSLFENCADLEWLAVTLGARGAELWHRSGRSWSHSAVREKVIDTVGAGDAFAAGLVHGLWQGVSGDEALAMAVGVAESILGQRGGLPSIDGAGRP